MKTPSRVTARLASPVTPRATAPGIPRRTAFATVLSGCDAEFALRVDPFCPSLNYVGHATARKRSHAQPYILTIGGRARSIAARRCDRTLIAVQGAAQGCQRRSHKFLDVLLTFWIAERRRACRAIAVAGPFFAAKLRKKITAG
jgi:hypothetical protein